MSVVKRARRRRGDRAEKRESEEAAGEMYDNWVLDGVRRRVKKAGGGVTKREGEKRTGKSMMHCVERGEREK